MKSCVGHSLPKQNSTRMQTLLGDIFKETYSFLRGELRFESIGLLVGLTSQLYEY